MVGGWLGEEDEVWGGRWVGVDGFDYGDGFGPLGFGISSFSWNMLVKFGKSAHYSRQSQLLQKCLKSVE